MSFPGGYDKIKLIKIVRERTGCGLKEAKDAVEQANGDLDLAVRIAFQNRRLSFGNGQPESSDKRRLFFTLPDERTVICLQKAGSKGTCNSCGKEEFLARADLILANGQVGSAHVCGRCLRVVYDNMDLIATFMGSGKLPEAGP